MNRMLSFNSDYFQIPRIKFEKYNVTMPSIEVKDEGGSGAGKDDMIVRGRTFDQSKPETFNQV